MRSAELVVPSSGPTARTSPMPNGRSGASSAVSVAIVAATVEVAVDVAVESVVAAVELTDPGSAVAIAVSRDGDAAQAGGQDQCQNSSR